MSNEKGPSPEARIKVIEFWIKTLALAMIVSGVCELFKLWMDL